MTRRPLVLGNWKMNLDERAAGALVAAVAARLAECQNADVGVAPPFPFLRAALDRAAGTRLTVGAQDVHWEDKGAFTGAVAAPMLAGMGASFAIIGHSERRQMFGDTDASVARKTAAALRHDLAPIVCVGETEAERLAGHALDVVGRQIRDGLSSVTGAPRGRLTVAYEPVWAIGTGRVPTTDQILEVHAFVRAALGDLFGAEPASEIRILYGGSVTPENAGEILRLADVDGALVGGASLDPARFLGIATAAR
jgi:triosephosphate isomerase